MKKNELYDQMYNIVENIEFLQKTSLFGQRISYPVQNRFAHIMNLQQYAAGEMLSTQEEPGLCENIIDDIINILCQKI